MDIEKYSTIINLPHYEPKRHPRMSMENRAAQFAPFAALEGHEDAMKETARLTSTKKILSKEEKIALSRELQNIINKGISACKIIHFIADGRKEGGEYHKTVGQIKKIDIESRKIFLHRGIVIELDNILSIESIIS